VRLKHADSLLGDLVVGRFHGLAAAGDIRRHPEQRAAALPVVEMISRKAGVDDPLCACLARPRRRLLRLPGAGDLLAHEVPNGFRIDLVFAAEVPIETAVVLLHPKST
jgi:hypothetical protein